MTQQPTDTAAANKTTRPRKTATRRPRTSTTGETPAPSSSSSGRRLPKPGTLVSYDSLDPLTGEGLQGVGIVVGSYSHGTGKDTIHRVNITKLTSDLNLAADDVHTVEST
jgi:hypothetical protein